MTNPRRLLGPASALAAVLLSTVPALAPAQAESLVHAGVKRRYIVYLPASYATSPDRQYPVVLHFHGGGMTMAEQMLYSGMNRAADRHDFIAVYPQGIGHDWNVGFGMSYEEGTDDVGFTEALLDHLLVTLRVDTMRVYATGLSRGGFFTHRLAAELSQRFAAVAAVGAPLPVPVRDAHRPRGAVHPVGIMLMHGTADRIVDHAGKAGHYLSAAATATWWARRNGMDGATHTVVERDADTADGTSVTVARWAGEQVAVSMLTIHGGGHSWPGADRFNVGLPLGVTSQEIDANEVIWAFLSAHRRE